MHAVKTGPKTSKKKTYVSTRISKVFSLKNVDLSTARVKDIVEVNTMRGSAVLF